MFNYDLLKVKLYGLVGMAGLLDVSRSGLDVGDVDPLIRRQNLLAVFPQDYPGGDAELAPYDESASYPTGAVVRTADGYYRSRVAANTAPLNDTLSWQPVTALQLHGENSYNTAIIRTLQGVTMLTKAGLATAPPLRQQPVIHHEANPSQVLAKSIGRFQGWIIKTTQPDTTARLERIGIQLGQPQAVTLYGMRQDPYGGPDLTTLKTYVIPAGRPYRTAWLDLAQSLYGDDQSEAAYYIGYFEDTIVGEIMRYPINLGQMTGNCSSCDARQRQLTTSRRQWVSLQPFSVDNQTPGQPDWPGGDEVYTDEHAFALNAEVSVSCDLTRLVLEQQTALATALQYQWAQVLVEQMARSQEQNPGREALVNPALYLLGNDLNPGGLTRLAAKHLKDVSLSWADLSPFCLAAAPPQQTIKLRSQYEDWTNR